MSSEISLAARGLLNEPSMEMRAYPVIPEEAYEKDRRLLLVKLRLNGT